MHCFYKFSKCQRRIWWPLERVEIYINVTNFIVFPIITWQKLIWPNRNIIYSYGYNQMYMYVFEYMRNNAHDPRYVSWHHSKWKKNMFSSEYIFVNMIVACCCFGCACICCPCLYLNESSIATTYSFQSIQLIILNNKYTANSAFMRSSMASCLYARTRSRRECLPLRRESVMDDPQRLNRNQVSSVPPAQTTQN